LKSITNGMPWRYLGTGCFCGKGDNTECESTMYFYSLFAEVAGFCLTIIDLGGEKENEETNQECYS